MQTPDTPRREHRMSLRLPHDLHDRLLAATKDSRRSAHAEILYSLDKTLPARTATPADIEETP